MTLVLLPLAITLLTGNRLTFSVANQQWRATFFVILEFDAIFIAGVFELPIEPCPIAEVVAGCSVYEVNYRIRFPDGPVQPYVYLVWMMLNPDY